MALIPRTGEISVSLECGPKPGAGDQHHGQHRDPASLAQAWGSSHPVVGKCEQMPLSSHIPVRSGRLLLTSYTAVEMGSEGQSDLSQVTRVNMKMRLELSPGIKAEKVSVCVCVGRVIVIK